MKGLLVSSNALDLGLLHFLTTQTQHTAAKTTAILTHVHMYHTHTHTHAHTHAHTHTHTHTHTSRIAIGITVQWLGYTVY